MDTLRLVPIFCQTRSDLLRPLARRLAHTFNVRIEQSPPNFNPELAFDASRGQYNSRILLALLERSTPPEIPRVLGVTTVDLFIPVLTYVFGEAQLGGRIAVVSAYRLDNALYGLPADASLLIERLCKESVHELGHTHNLTHCTFNTCVMASSTYVDGVDLKSDHFCDACRRALRSGYFGRASTGIGG